MIKTSNQAIDVLEAACNLLDWHVFACYGIENSWTCNCRVGSACTNPGKHPANKNGFKEAVSHQDAVKHIMFYGPRRNVGIACKISNILVIDIDPRNGGHHSFEQLKELTQLPTIDTVEALTGNYLVDGIFLRGRHVYFQVPKNYSFVTNLKAFPGIDFKHNGYVVAPPSMHATGVSYEWVEGRSPEEIPLHPLPHALMELLAVEEYPNRSLQESITQDEFDALNEQNFGPTAQTALKNLVDELRNTREGSRNNQTFLAAVTVASWAAGGTVPLSESLDAVVEAAMETGLPAQEVIDTVVRAIPRGLANPQQAWAFEPWMEEAARAMAAQMSDEE